MKKLLTYIKDFVRQEYSAPLYAAVFVFLGVVITLNYTIRLENQWIKEQESLILQFCLYFTLYAIAYYGTLTILYFIKKINYFSNREVMTKSLLALLLVSFDRAFGLTSEGLQQLFPFEDPEAVYLVKIINLVCPALFYLTVIFLACKTYSENANSLYGLSFRQFDLSPYFYMLLCMIPLLLLASFRSDFTSQYPFFKYWKYEPAFGLSRLQLFSLYEIFYLGNFINIELLFRGLLVIGMVRMMGKDAVLPMVVTYAFLHFGKPFPETISSIFGGYILGIFAYKTENIIGGVFIHMAIALLMDVFALWQLQ